jgi:hypothetical protein
MSALGTRRSAQARAFGLVTRAERNYDLQGSIETRSTTDIQGWVWDARDPSRRLRVSARAAGREVAKTVADVYRADLEKAGVGDGCHGFILRFEKCEPRSLSVEVEDLGVTIPIAPRAVNNDAETIRRKRHFILVPGYDPYGPAFHYRRFVRELSRFRATWNVAVAASDLTILGSLGGQWIVSAAAPGWNVETCVEIFDWYDIVVADLRSSTLRRLWKSIVTFFDFVGSGTVKRYFLASWRYMIFFLLPFLNVALCASFALLVGWCATLILGWAGLKILVAGGIAAIITVASFALLMRWPGRAWRVDQGLADWTFARDYMLRRRSDIEARVNTFADRLLSCVRSGGVDEIVIAGHSLGATLVIDILSRALARDPSLGRRGPTLGVLTIGATIPKLALHPSGGLLREAACRVAAEPSLLWAEFQAPEDIISFYKFHPVALGPCNAIDDAGRPLVRAVKIRDMLSESAFRRYRFNMMRLHYQFVMANERRTLYDYFMLVCGPQPFWLTGGPADLYCADGSMREPTVAPFSARF